MAIKKEVKARKNIKESKEKTESEANKEIEKQKELSLKQKQNRQIIWALVLMAGVIIIIFLVPYIKQNVFNKFEYIGLDFYKTKTSDIVFYYTKIPFL